MAASRRSLGLLGSIFVMLGLHAPASASTVLHLEVPGLVERAELVFEGRVVSRRAFVAENGLIQTEYVVRTGRTFLGAVQSSRVFRLPGGVLEGGRSAMIPGMSPPGARTSQRPRSPSSTSSTR